MTQLRDRMLEELERRNYAPGTARAYLFAVKQFAEHFHRAPDQLGAEHIREIPVEYIVISMLRCSRLAEAASNRLTSSRLSTVGSFSGNRGNGRCSSM